MVLVNIYLYTHYTQTATNIFYNDIKIAQKIFNRFSYGRISETIPGFDFNIGNYRKFLQVFLHGILYFHNWVESLKIIKQFWLNRTENSHAN